MCYNLSRNSPQNDIAGRRPRVEYLEICESNYDVFHELANAYYREGEDENTPQAEMDAFIGFLFEMVVHKKIHGCFVKEGNSCIGFALWAVDTADFPFSQIPGFGTILEIGIIPSRRGSGLGRELVWHIEAFFQNSSIKRCYVSAYGPAQRFWESCGYGENGQKAHNGLPIMVKAFQ